MNGYTKYLTGENHLQMSVIRYLKSQYPKVLWIHVHNEGSRTRYERYVAKVTGLTTGVSDLLIFERTPIYGALALELKYGSNKLTEHQKWFLKTMHQKGYCSAVAYNIDEAIVIIKHYLKGYQLDYTKYFLN